MSSPAVVILLRLFHILSGVFWVGSVLFFAHFILPTAAVLGPAAGPVMDQLARVRKVPQTLLALGTITVLSGLGLYWHDSVGFQSDWMRSPTGTVFSAGGGLAIIALLIGATVGVPTAKRLGALMATIQAGGSPPSPDQAAALRALQTRVGNALRIAAVLLLLATTAMAVARYVK